jgi:redox-sensing transcriptional repressor
MQFMKKQESIVNKPSEEIIERLKLYQPILRLWKYREKHQLTLQMISEILNIAPETVFGDFQYCPSWDKSPDELLDVNKLIDCIDSILGKKDFREALLIGIGKLGTSLLRNERIAGSGLKIVAAFDIDPEKTGKVISGIKVQNMDKLEVFVRQMHIKMAMIASTPENAHQAAEQAINSGIHVIWNFTPTRLEETPGVIIQNTSSMIDIDHDYKKILTRL